MGIWNRLIAIRRGGDWIKEGEGISQRTYMHDPWTWTMGWGSPEGHGGGGGGGGQSGNKWGWKATLLWVMGAQCSVQIKFC